MKAQLKRIEIETRNTLNPRTNLKNIVRWHVIIDGVARDSYTKKKDAQRLVDQVNNA